MGRPGLVEYSFDARRLDVETIHRFLSTESYWCRGIPRATVERAIAHSLCVGAYLDGEQVGFARLITDRATFAYLGDVFVVASARHRGIASRMLEALFGHDDVQGLRRVLLFTADAHALYGGLGFKPLARPERAMEIVRPDLYAAAIEAPTPGTRC